MSNNQSSFIFHQIKNQASQEEIEEAKSAYSKIPKWLEENKNVINRKQKVGNDGKVEEKRPSLFPCVKAMLFNQSKLKGQQYEDLCASVRYIVEEVMRISPSTFYNTYDTKFMKEHKMYPGITSLIEQTPPEIQKECYFNHKDIVFRTVWPEFYEKNIANEITSRDIVYATNSKKDMFKSNILRAGQVKNIIKKDKGSKFGDLVDEMLFDAIQEHFLVGGICSTIPEIFLLLGDISNPSNKNAEETGGNDIAISRGYKSILDFFYLNLPEQMQEIYGMPYLDIRKDCGLKAEPILEIAILTRLGRTEMLESYGISEENSLAI